MNNTVTINSVDYKIKYTIRALFIMEQITGKPFQVKTLLDNYIFFYSMILANNQDKILDWNVFIDALDNDPNLFKQLTEIGNSFNKKDSMFQQDEDGESKKK